MFTVQDNAVWMTGAHKPWRMSDGAVETMLDLFEDAGEAALFNELYAAQQRAMGDLFIPRATSFPKLRLVQ